MKEQKAAQQLDIVRAGKNLTYRASLRVAELPNEASGLIELEHLEHIRGGNQDVRNKYDQTARNIIANMGR